MSEAALKQVKELATQLSRPEQAKLAQWLDTMLEDGGAMPSPPASRSLYGLWADLGPGPTDADIDEARRESWGSFPREDIA